MDVEGKDIHELLQVWEKVISMYKMSSGFELPSTVLAATAMEHLPDRYQPMLSQIPMAQREALTALRLYIREWHVSTRGYDERGVGSSTHVPMNVNQVKGKKGDKGKYKGDKRQGQVEEQEQGLWQDQ